MNRIPGTNFTYQEFEHSETAKKLNISNTIPSEQIRANIRCLVLNVLQPLRDILKRPIVINSGYRSAVLNTAVGGAAESQHMKGQAADIRCIDSLQVLLVAQTILNSRIPFDQMILHSSFLHVSFNPDGKQRSQIIYHESYKDFYITNNI